MQQLDILVAINALPEVPPYVRFPDIMQDDIISGFKGGNYAILHRNLYDYQTVPKLCRKCLHDCLMKLGFKKLLVIHTYSNLSNGQWKRDQYHYGCICKWSDCYRKRQFSD